VSEFFYFAAKHQLAELLATFYFIDSFELTVCYIKLHDIW